MQRVPSHRAMATLPIASPATLLTAIVLNGPIRGGTMFYGLDGAYIRSFIRESTTWVPTGAALTFDQVRGPWNLMPPLKRIWFPSTCFNSASTTASRHC